MKRDGWNDNRNKTGTTTLVNGKLALLEQKIKQWTNMFLVVYTRRRSVEKKFPTAFFKVEKSLKFI
jgi:hypothetical protein